MTHINIDDFTERLLQRAEAEQNVANRLYEAKVSKESYQKAHVTAGVLRELAATFEQMSEDHPSINDIQGAKEQQEAALGLIWDLIEYIEGVDYADQELLRQKNQVKDLLAGNPPPKPEVNVQTLKERANTSLRLLSNIIYEWENHSIGGSLEDLFTAIKEARDVLDGRVDVSEITDHQKATAKREGRLRGHVRQAEVAVENGSYNEAKYEIQQMKNILAI